MAGVLVKVKDHLADVPVISSSTEMLLSGGRVVLIQRIGNVVRITSGHRRQRNVTSSLVTGGTVLLPLPHLRAIFREVMAAAQDEE